MKNIIMTICGVLLMSTVILAQSSDSTYNRSGNTDINGNRTQQPRIDNSTDSIDGTTRTQEQTSPTGQPLSQPQIESDRNLQSQPELHSQPIQRQPQVPAQPQSQPVNPNNPVQQNQTNQNQLNQPVEPMQSTQPVNRSVQPVSPAAAPTTPTGAAPLGSQPPK